MSDKDVVIESYIKKIDNLLPYSKSTKLKTLERLKSDVLESLKDANTKDPFIVFGDPKKVAQDVGKSQNWTNNRASYKKRTLAILIDTFIQYIAILLGFIIWFNFIGYNIGDTTFQPKDELLAVLTLVFILLPYTLLWIVGYFIILERLFNTTPGKFVLGILVVDESGIRINWFQSIIRNLSKSQILLLIIETIIGYIEKTNHQRPLDVVAKTIVINKA